MSSGTSTAVLTYTTWSATSVPTCCASRQRDERVREIARALYVGLSRARDQLVVCGEPGFIEEVGGPDLARRLGVSKGLIRVVQLLEVTPRSDLVGDGAAGFDSLRRRAQFVHPIRPAIEKC